MGLIFETFGPVKQPFYSIRFNSREDLEKLNVAPGESLYFSPDFSELVKIEKLLKQKGCDASWEDDKECPEKFLVYFHVLKLKGCRIIRFLMKSENFELTI